MKGKIRQMALFILAIFLFSTLVGCLKPEEKKGVVEGVDYSIEPAEAGWKWFVNNYHGYRFKFPEDWYVDYYWETGEEVESLDGVYIDEPEHGVGVGYGFFAVEIPTREEMKKELKRVDMNRYDRQSFAKSKIETMLADKYFQDFELLEYKNISLDGVPSTLIRYTYTPMSPSPNCKPKFRKMYLFTYSEEIRGKVYSLGYVASRPLDQVDRLTENLPTVMKMIESFEFI